MAKTAWFVSKFPFPLTAISLGRFVTVPSNPSQNFFDPTMRLTAKLVPQQDHSNLYDISRYINQSSGTKLESILTSFASTFFQLNNASFRELAACQATKYFILNIDDWFDRICQETEFQLWLEREHMRNRTVYLVAEYCTLTHPSIKDGKEFDISGGLSVGVPVAAAAADIPKSTPLDPSMSVQAHFSNKQQQSHQVVDEKVFWVGYHKVKTSRNQKGQLEHMLSQRRTWVELCDVRDANIDGFEITADLEEVHNEAGYSQVEIEDQSFLFEQSTQ